jgi:fibronectin type 3 domain-containing protein
VVTAVSQADSTKSATSTISVAAAHSVTLGWSPSSSSGVAYYNVYRGTVSGGPFTLLKSGVGTTSYLDGNVISGSTYYYVTTAVDSSGAESAYSNQAKAVIPIP